MIHVGICDDDKKHRKALYELVSKIIFKYDDAEFSYFSSGNELIERIENNEFFCDLLLLDIHMPNMDGLETAKYIRTNQVDVDIFFITVSTEHVFDGYTYQAFSYLVKPVDQVRLADDIGRYIEQRNQYSNCLHLTINGRREQIFLDRVFYFSGDARKVLIHQKAEEEPLAFYAKLSEVEETLRTFGFIRCHQSYLVNRKYITAYTRTELTVAGEQIPISRRYIEQVRDAMESDKEVEYGVLSK